MSLKLRIVMAAELSSTRQDISDQSRGICSVLDPVSGDPPSGPLAIGASQRRHTAAVNPGCPREWHSASASARALRRRGLGTFWRLEALCEAEPLRASQVSEGCTSTLRQLPPDSHAAPRALADIQFCVALLI